MARQRQDADDLARLEQKIDRLTWLMAAVAICQPMLLIGLVMPDAATQFLTVSLLALLIVLVAFPNLEVRLPVAMRRSGRILGRFGRRVRSFRDAVARNPRQDTAP